MYKVSYLIFPSSMAKEVETCSYWRNRNGQQWKTRSEAISINGKSHAIHEDMVETCKTDAHVCIKNKRNWLIENNKRNTWWYYCCDL